MRGIRARRRRVNGPSPIVAFEGLEFVEERAADGAASQDFAHHCRLIGARGICLEPAVLLHEISRAVCNGQALAIAVAQLARAGAVQAATIAGTVW